MTRITLSLASVRRCHFQTALAYLPRLSSHTGRSAGVGQREHHHLPEIPSQKEVAEKGVSVGEMQSKLLAKIEELTLHLIDADEKNRELQAQIEQLEARTIGDAKEQAR